MNDKPTTKERPILFSAPMVRAILEGRKTQTRRIVKPQPDYSMVGVIDWKDIRASNELSLTNAMALGSPYGVPGERLWVRETWGYELTAKAVKASLPRAGIPPQAECEAVYYRASDGWNGPWLPSIHMPRWASRIDLTNSCARIERLQDVSEADALAEGVEFGLLNGVMVFKNYATGEMSEPTARGSYRSLWESINGPGSWEVNPWVWVVEFERVTA